MEQQRDDKLWRIARQRVAFRKSLYSYLVVNTFLWIIWWFTSGRKGFDMNDGGIPWPLWVMLGWGLGLAISYYKAYHSDGSDMAEREYEKLKEREGR